MNLKPTLAACHWIGGQSHHLFTIKALTVDQNDWIWWFSTLEQARLYHFTWDLSLHDSTVSRLFNYVQAPKDRNWWKSWHLLDFIKFNKGFRKVTRPNFMVLLTLIICKQYFKQRILRLHQLYVPSTGRSNVWFCVSHQDTSVKTATWTHTRLIRNTRPRVQCSWPLGHDTPSLLILSLLPAPISVRLAK